MTKIKTISILSILIASLMLTAPLIWADTTSTTPTSTIDSTTSTTLASTSISTTLPTNPHPMPLIVEIGPAGNALIRGTVTNIGTDSLTIKTWGGTWTIKIDSNTKFAPQGLTLSQIQTNDFIGLNGKVNSEETLTVDATLIRDWTEKKIIKEETQQNKKEVKQIIEAAKIRILTAVTIDATSKTLTANLNNQTITIKLADNAKILDRNWRTITLDKIQVNDTIRTYGTLSGTTLEASVIRDISIPKK
jgi:hypothetical protein